MPTIIVVEGLDGVGKSTVAEAVANKLKAMNKPTILAREPGFTGVGEKIRNELLLSHTKMTEVSLFYLFQVARIEMLQSFIDNHMDKEYIVLDRFWPSTIAYQVAGSGVPMRLFDECQLVVDRMVKTIGEEMDFCILLPEEMRKKRMSESGKGGDRMERRPASFFENVEAQYQRMVNSKLLRPVSGLGSPDWIAGKILDEVLH